MVSSHRTLSFSVDIEKPSAENSASTVLKMTMHAIRAIDINIDASLGFLDCVLKDKDPHQSRILQNFSRLESVRVALYELAYQPP